VLDAIEEPFDVIAGSIEIWAEADGVLAVSFRRNVRPRLAPANGFDHSATLTDGDQSRGTIAGEGVIDVEKVRDAIKRIMEGGEAAFNLRKEKYGF